LLGDGDHFVSGGEIEGRGLGDWGGGLVWFD
jgi:hypothetical protein